MVQTEKSSCNCLFLVSNEIQKLNKRLQTFMTIQQSNFMPVKCNS